MRKARSRSPSATAPGSDSTYIIRVYDLDSGRQFAERTMSVSFPTDVPVSVVTTLNDDIIDGTASGATRLRVDRAAHCGAMTADMW